MRSRAGAGLAVGWLVLLAALWAAVAGETAAAAVLFSVVAIIGLVLVIADRR